MKLTFIGAAHEVTGSCFYLEACGKKILVDCGMEQGRDYYVNQELPVSPSEIDAVLLTHSHIDHTGNLPLIYKNGFRGNVYATGATTSLCNIMLQDSAHIQEYEAELKNRKRNRAGQGIIEPPYTMQDALAVIKKFVPKPYNEVISLYPGINFRFVDVGHLLGSASIEIWITEGDISKKLVFSGDIGNDNKPLLKDPQYIKEADYVVMESTYGDSNHEQEPDYVTELSEIIQTTFDRGGNVVIPSFAVGRTQELLYFIHQIKKAHLVKGHGDFKVYIDSPLANEATQIFKENAIGYFDEEAMEMIRQGENPLTFPGLVPSITTEDSKAINLDKNSKVIISASGMCEAGRIRHHLKHNLWRKDSTVLFVGYQALGTLGRIILDGAEEVKLFGDTIRINAQISKLAGISSHADMESLISWISNFEKKPQRVFIVHGESEVIDSFSNLLENTYGFNVETPFSGAVYDLASNECVDEGTVIEIQRNADEKPYKRQKSTSSLAFERLVNAGRHLMTVIKHNEGGTNKDLNNFEEQIKSLSDKWDR